MSYYPSIDYVGAAQGIVNQLSDLPRVDREIQNRDIQQSNLESMKMSREIHQNQLDEYKRKRQVADEIGRMVEIEGIPEDGDIGPQLGKMAVRAFQMGSPDTGMSLATQYKAWKAEDRQSMEDQYKLAGSVYKINRKAGVGVFKALKSKHPNDPFLSALNPDLMLESNENEGIVYPAKTPEGEEIPNLYVTIDTETGKSKLQYIKPETKKAPTSLGYNEGNQHVTEIYRDGELERTIKAPRYKPETGGAGAGGKPPTRADIRSTISKVNTMKKDPANYEPPEGGWPTKGKIDPQAMGLKLKESAETEINELLDSAGYPPLEMSSRDVKEYRDWGLFKTGEKTVPAYSYKVKEKGGESKKGKTLDAATAQKFYDQAGGDKNKARKLAREAGYNF